MENIVAKEEIAFFFCHYVFKKSSAAKASESVYMREKVQSTILEIFHIFSRHFQSRLLQICCMLERVKSEQMYKLIQTNIVQKCLHLPFAMH